MGLLHYWLKGENGNISEMGNGKCKWTVWAELHCCSGTFFHLNHGFYLTIGQAAIKTGCDGKVNLDKHSTECNFATLCYALLSCSRPMNCRLLGESSLGEQHMDNQREKPEKADRQRDKQRMS